MFDKLKFSLDVFRKGSEIANATAWKNHQITGTLFAGFILSIINLVGTFGYSIPVDPDTANAIGAGIVAVINVVLTYATSSKVGILPEKPSDGTSDPIINTGMQNPNISDETREAALQYVNKANDELRTGINPTYDGR